MNNQIRKVRQKILNIYSNEPSFYPHGIPANEFRGIVFFVIVFLIH